MRSMRGSWRVSWAGAPQESFETGLRKTVEWYLANAAWVEGVTSGAYQQWMTQNYAGREAEVSCAVEDDDDCRGEGAR